MPATLLQSAPKTRSRQHRGRASTKTANRKAQQQAQPEQLCFEWQENSPVSESTPTASDSLSSSAVQQFPGADQRYGKPVRIGAVMIKLLKSYGITDEEIACGLANYARKHATSLAS